LFVNGLVGVAAMMNNILNAIVIVALVGTFVLAPTHRLVVSHDTLSGGAVHQAVASQNDRGKSAAIAAIEAAGYENIRLLAREANGNWRAKAYRTAGEVTVLVDERGRVLVE
jgi:hypothetical protein